MIQLLNLRTQAWRAVDPRPLKSVCAKRCFHHCPWSVEFALGLLRVRARLSFAKSHQVTAVPICVLNVDIPGLTQGFRDVVAETCWVWSECVCCWSFAWKLLTFVARSQGFFPAVGKLVQVEGTNKREPIGCFSKAPGPHLEIMEINRRVSQ